MMNEKQNTICGFVLFGAIVSLVAGFLPAFVIIYRLVVGTQPYWRNDPWTWVGLAGFGASLIFGGVFKFLSELWGLDDPRRA